MQQVCLFYLFQTIFVSAGSVRPSSLHRVLTPPSHPSLNGLDIPEAENISISNNMSLLDHPLVFTFDDGTARLPGKACLMVALETLVQLSFMQNDKPYSHGSYSSNDYPEVLITIKTFKLPRPELTLRTSFAITCVIKLISKMIWEGAFRNSTTTAYWTQGSKSLALGQVAFFANEEGATH